MKNIRWVLIIMLIVLGMGYIYAHARNRLNLPRPEDMAGNAASAFMPQETSKGQPVAKGSSELKLTGPVWVESEK